MFIQKAGRKVRAIYEKYHSNVWERGSKCCFLRHIHHKQIGKSQAKWKATSYAQFHEENRQNWTTAKEAKPDNYVKKTEAFKIFEDLNVSRLRFFNYIKVHENWKCLDAGGPCVIQIEERCENSKYLKAFWRQFNLKLHNFFCKEMYYKELATTDGYLNGKKIGAINKINLHVLTAFTSIVSLQTNSTKN